MAGPTFTTPLAFPFFRGSSVAATAGPTETGPFDAPLPFTVTLDGYLFPVEVKEWRSGPLDTFRDTIVANDQPSDALFNARGAWSRYRYDWRLGAGQELGDLVDDAIAQRFRSSLGMVWHEQGQLTLQPSASLTRSGAGTVQLLCRVGDYVFFAEGANLYRSSDLSTWTACTAPGGTIRALSTDGTDLYVATSTVMQKYVAAATTPTAFTTAVTGDCTNVAFCSNRLLLAKTNVLYEVGSDGTLATIKTHFQSAFSWTTIFNIGSRIYIGGYAGSRSELHTATTDSYGNLIESQEAAPLPMGEKLNGGYSYAGAAFLLTSNGIRTANVSGDGTLTYGPLIEELGDVRCAVADGRYLFAGWSTMDDGHSGVARMVLDEEVQPLLPAWGADAAEATTQAAVTGVARLGGRTIFAVSGSGAWVTSTTAFVSDGVIDSGRLSFGTVEPKMLTSLDVYFAPLVSGESIEARVYDDDDTLLASGITTAVDATSLTVDLGGEQVGSARVVLAVGGAGTGTPTIHRWRMRAYPVAPATYQWVLPLIVAEQVLVGDGEGQDHPIALDDTLDWIETLYATKRYTLLRVGTRSYRVRVETYEWRPANWTDDGAYPQGLLVVQLVKA